MSSSDFDPIYTTIVWLLVAYRHIDSDNSRLYMYTDSYFCIQCVMSYAAMWVVSLVGCVSDIGRNIIIT